MFQIGDRRYARFPRLAHAPGLVHAFTTRPFDVSARDDDSRDERQLRRRTMAADLGLSPDRLHYCVQVHGVEIAPVGDAAQPGPLHGQDAVVTATTGAALMTFSADCPLVLLFDPKTPALALVHASWRCSVAALTRRAVEALGAWYGVRPEDLQCGIGPGAGPCCYEVGPDVVAAAEVLPDAGGLFSRRDGRIYFDLWTANRDQLIRSGVRPENIELAGDCTMCRNDVFYSYRREGPGCGHFGLMAALVSPY